MPHYENTDINFDYPREWEDKSVVAFAAPQRGGQKTATNIVLLRDNLGDGEDVTRYADRQLVAMAQQLNGFQLFEKKDTTVDGEPAVDVRIAWRSANGQVLAQRLVMVAKLGRVFNLTLTTLKKDAPEFGPIFDRVLASTKLTQTQ